MTEHSEIPVPALKDILARLILIDAKLDTVQADIREIAEGLSRADDQMIAATYKLARIDARMAAIEDRICN